MSLAKQISVRMLRTAIYPPVGVFWGAVAGFAVGIVLLFWAWLLSLFVHFDLGKTSGVVISICLAIGIIGGFLVGLWNGIFEDVDD